MNAVIKGITTKSSRAISGRFNFDFLFIMSCLGANGSGNSTVVHSSRNIRQLFEMRNLDAGHTIANRLRTFELKTCRSEEKTNPYIGHIQLIEPSIASSLTTIHG